MLTIETAKGICKLPIAWHEVTTRQFCELSAQPDNSIVDCASYFTGYPIGESEIIADALSFLQTPPTAEKNHWCPADLGQQSFLAVESMRKLLAEQPLHTCFNKVFANAGYQTQPRSAVFDQGKAAALAAAALDWPITDTYPAVAFALLELERLKQAFAVLTEPDESETAQRARSAGSERLNGFGFLAVARHYAEKFKLDLGQVLVTPWQTIMLVLLEEKIINEIVENMRNKAERES